ncbi:hypothetical protein QYE76_055748 [Lolium multiflorum]|uniref:Uncharacterized protein n=1 Tax=Lolium multiflorum TaxID=4521 RepID=A0AAD8T1C4_LOLMU|nr:hypothetical protein QYE76_055748 [Lolium multiflorum]
MPLPLGDFGAAVADFVPVGNWLFEMVPLAASNRPWPGRAEGPPLVSPPRIVARSRLRLSFSCSGTRKIRHPPPSFVRPWPGHPIPLYISLSQLLGREEGVGVQEMGRWGGCWDSFTSMALYQKSPNPRLFLHVQAMNRLLL